MARELGMSKSALYHYFSSKDALFFVCSERVARISLDTEKSPVEVRIMLDYIGDRPPEDLRRDEALDVAMEGIVAGLSQIVSVHLIPQVLSAVAVFGFLLLRYFNGRRTPREELEKLLESLI
jgi:TetR/AcrR family transcriptional regulator, transcriptional repressor of aconitase